MGYHRSMHSRIPRRLLLILTALALPIAIASSRALSHPAEPTGGSILEQPTQSPEEERLKIPANRHTGGLLAFEVSDAATGKPIPCKLTFVGVEGTPRPVFTHNDIGRPEGELAISAFDRVFSAAGSEEIRVPLGSYDIYVSRGPEWDVSVNRKVKIGPEGAKVVAKLRHVVDTAGWLSADFHVHAAPSPDSIVPLSHRILEFVADGIDMIVSPDHNVVTDYAPTIRQLGLGTLITSARGDELTTNGWGHYGAFPLPQDMARAGQGAVLVHGHNAKEIFANVREHAPEAVIDVHHPRIDPGVGYFIVGEFDPHSDRAGRPGFSFDFDALEVLNGYQDPARKSVDRIIDDWLGLLNHGHIVTATGNSDTHHLTYNMGGYPRNYVRVNGRDIDWGCLRIVEESGDESLGRAAVSVGHGEQPRLKLGIVYASQDRLYARIASDRARDDGCQHREEELGHLNPAEAQALGPHDEFSLADVEGSTSDNVQEARASSKRQRSEDLASAFLEFHRGLGRPTFHRQDPSHE